MAAYQCLFLKWYLQPIYLKSKIMPNFDAIALTNWLYSLFQSDGMGYLLLEAYIFQASHKIPYKQTAKTEKTSATFSFRD